MKSKKRKQKAKKKRWKIPWSIAFLIIMLGIFMKYIGIGEDETIITNVPIQNENEFPTKDWCLTLVNKWNPLEKQEEITLTTLSNGQQVDRRIYPALQQMFDDARADGVYPIVASGYRTKEKQQQLYDEKMDSYLQQGYSKEEAKKATEQWVAVPGTSEHQLGLGIDINADGIHSSGDEVYKWLEEHAYQYGFIHRYPQNKTDITGIANEPWHYRYVGVEAAREIYQQGICFEEYVSDSFQEN